MIQTTYRGTQDLNQVSSEELDTILPQIFDLLYSKIFNSSEGWVLKNDVEYTLDKLVQWRDIGAGPKIGIISNFDERLHNILAGMYMTHTLIINMLI